VSAVEISCELEAAGGECAAAARLAGAAAAARMALGAPRPACLEACLARILERARATLGEEAWRRNRLEGATLGLEEAAAIAARARPGDRPADQGGPSLS
jgi:hypothetical protein